MEEERGRDKGEEGRGRDAGTMTIVEEVEQEKGRSKKEKSGEKVYRNGRRREKVFHVLVLYVSSRWSE